MHNALVMLITFATRNPYANLAWLVLLLLLFVTYEGHRRAKNDLKAAEQRLARTQAKVARTIDRSPGSSKEPSPG